MLFATGPETVGGRTINVSAEFNVDLANSRITLTLLNLQMNPTSLNQLLGSVRFNLDGAGADPSMTLVSSSIGTFAINSTGTPTTHNVANAWTVNALSGTQFAFCTVCDYAWLEGTNATELIVGGPGTGNIYTTSDTTIRAKHDPYILGSGQSYSSGALAGLDSVPSWTFYVPGMTPTVTVSSVIFGFGTGPLGLGGYGSYFAEVDEFVVPDARPLLSAGGGILLMIAGLRRKRRS